MECTEIVAVTYPLDLTKTRLQIQGEKGLSGTAAVPYRGMIRTATGIGEISQYKMPHN